MLVSAIIISSALTLSPEMLLARAQSGIAHAILFFSPSCSHCQKVIQEDLPPIREKFGDQLDILEVDVSGVEGQALYRAAVEKYNIPEEQRGVPCIIVGDIVLVGSQEIPEKLPEIIEEGLATGGVPWPAIPGLNDRLSNQPEQTSETESATSGRGFIDKFTRDPIGNFLAVIVLIVLVASAIISSVRVFRLPEREQRLWPKWIPFTLIVIGMGVALYLSYIELTHTQAVCGPVGDCNTVQQSPYAKLFGVIPVGLLGVAGYLSIGLAWIVQKSGKDQWKNYGAWAAWAFALFGVLFFIYLTFLEPFVIGATCAWCLTSAVVMILLLWASTSPAIEAWKASE